MGLVRALAIPSNQMYWAERNRGEVGIFNRLILIGIDLYAILLRPHEEIYMQTKFDEFVVFLSLSFRVHCSLHRAFGRTKILIRFNKFYV